MTITVDGIYKSFNGFPALRGPRDRLVGREQFQREFGLGIVDGAGQRVDGAADARGIGAVSEHRHLALGKISHRKARRERQHDAVA